MLVYQRIKMNFSVLISTTIFLFLFSAKYSASPLNELTTTNSSLPIGEDEVNSTKQYGNNTKDQGLCIICHETRTLSATKCSENQVYRRGACRTVHWK